MVGLLVGDIDKARGEIAIKSSKHIYSTLLPLLGDGGSGGGNKEVTKFQQKKKGKEI